jgi:molecular chaperone HtpG
MLTEDKFYEKAVNFCLVKNIDDKYFTLDEYKTLIEGAQTDKNETLVYLYANSKDDQYAHIDAAKSKGYDVLIMDGQLDIHWMGMIEQKFGKTRFVRVDSDTIDHLIQKEEVANVELTDKQKENMTEAVKSLLPTVTKAEFDVDFKALSENDKPVQITQNEFSRRMKEMSAMQPGMAFYGEMPDMFQVVLNVNHPLIKQVINEVENREKDDMKAYASENKKLKQMIDLALLSNGMLKGEALSDFIKRSIDLM